MKRILAIILVLILAFCFTACGTTDEPAEEANSYVSGGTQEEPVEVGEGANQFKLEVVTGNEDDFFYLIKTDEETVGNALAKLGMIEGEQGQYGLYIKYVNGELHDYEVDQTYWGFYIDGEYAELSCDLTEIEEGKLYTLKAEVMEG